MSSARKTLKILALVYFVLGIASLVIAGVGIATGNLDSTYGSNAMLAAVVLVAKGLIDLAAGVAKPDALRAGAEEAPSLLLHPFADAVADQDAIRDMHRLSRRRRRGSC